MATRKCSVPKTHGCQDSGLWGPAPHRSGGRVATGFSWAEGRAGGDGSHLGGLVMMWLEKSKRSLLIFRKVFTSSSSSVTRIFSCSWSPKEFWREKTQQVGKGRLWATLLGESSGFPGQIEGSPGFLRGKDCWACSSPVWEGILEALLS